jgi:hypothetical protein
MAFAPTLTIAMLVLATGMQDLAPAVAVPLWWLGAVGHLMATLAVLTAWLTRDDLALAQVTPAWFIPVVGNVVTPLAAPALGSIEFAWFAFGVGLIAWLGLFPILLHRLFVAGQGLPTRLRPTLMILVAPPAVMVLSLTTLVGGPLDPVRRILFAAALFAAALVMVQPGQWRLPFGLPFLAYTFPLAALAAAAVAVDAAAGGDLGGRGGELHVELLREAGRRIGVARGDLALVVLEPVGDLLGFVHHTAFGRAVVDDGRGLVRGVLLFVDVGGVGADGHHVDLGGLVRSAPTKREGREADERRDDEGARGGRGHRNPPRIAHEMARGRVIVAIVGELGPGCARVGGRAESRCVSFPCA